MNVEFSVTSAHAKSRAITLLLDAGFRAESGPVRLAYPFAILVEDVPEADQDVVQQLVAEVDPGMGRITVAAGVEGTTPQSGSLRRSQH